MSETVNLPALGESVTEGTVTRWLVEVGDEVEVDQPIVEVSTDKVDTEVPSPAAGVIEELLVDEDETVEVGAPLVTIGDGSGGSGSGESASADDAGESAEQSEPEPEQPAAESSSESSSDSGSAQDAGSGQQSTESGGAESGGSGDSQEVTLPALGESVTEGTVTRWLVEVGDEVDVDQPLLEVSTDKVDTEVPSPVAGTIQEIKVGEDETVEVGALLALVGSGAPNQAASSDEGSAPAAEQSSASGPAEEAPAAPSEDSAQAEQESSSSALQESSGSAEQKQETSSAASAGQSADSSSESASSTDASAEGYVTPLVRRLAKKEDIDLSQISGTGVGGRIRKQDVLDAIESKKSAAESSATQSSAATGTGEKPAASPAEVPVDTTKRGTTEKAPRIRQVIAQRMKESLEVSAQLTQVQEVDMTRVVNLRARSKATFKQQNGVNLTYLPFIATAVTEALKQHPKLNAAYDQDEQKITYHDAEHLALAVDTDRGLLVPVIADAGDLSIPGLAKRIADVGERTRGGKIGPEELSGGTFTITNIGSVGALFDTPIINQPQVAILGTGTIEKRPKVVTDADGNDAIAIRHLMYLSLTYDHRIVDGADAGRFLQTLKARLEEGAFEAQVGA